MEREREILQEGRPFDHLDKLGVSNKLRAGQERKGEADGEVPGVR